MTEIPEHLVVGPKDGVSYPLTLQYCGNCSMPLEVSKQTRSHLKLYLTEFRPRFRCSIVNTIRTMRNAKHGWKKICQRSFPRCVLTMVRTAPPVVKMKRNVKNVAERACSKRKRSKKMDRKKYAFREHLAAKGRAWPLWPALVLLVGSLVSCWSSIATHPPDPFEHLINEIVFFTGPQKLTWKWLQNSLAQNSHAVHRWRATMRSSYRATSKMNYSILYQRSGQKSTKTQ